MDAKTRDTIWSDDDWKAHLASLDEEPAPPKEEETPPEPVAEGGEEAAEVPESPASEEAPEGEPAPETPETPEGEEAPSVVPTTLEVKFRGAQRIFDLKNEAELKEVTDAISKGLNYEALLREDDQRIDKMANRKRDDYFREQGIVALDPSTNSFQPSAHGIAKWALAVLGPEKFQTAITDVLGSKSPSPSGGAGGLSVTELDAIEEEAKKDPEDPVNAANLRMVKALKGAATEIQSLRSGFDTRIKSFEDRFKGMDEAQKQQAQQEYQRAMFTHLDAEIGKVKGSAFDADDRDFLLSKAARLEREAIQQGKQWTPDLSKQCITAAVKSLAAKRVSTEIQRQQTEKEAKIEARPKPKAPPPAASAPKPAPPSKGKTPVTREDRAKAWDNLWQEEVVQKAR